MSWVIRLTIYQQTPRVEIASFPTALFFAPGAGAAVEYTLEFDAIELGKFLRERVGEVSFRLSSLCIP